MTNAAWNPLQFGTLAELGSRLRSGLSTCERVTTSYLDRIRALNPRLGAYTHVAYDEALASARRIDGQLAAGTDLGPLMGMPVAIKDFYTVTGMPTTAGTRVDVEDLVEPEGTFVGLLKRAGCVVLGKTRTTEFAAGTFNLTHPTPWNPWDMRMQRMPGGSSSGSAVALAADLCAFSIGSDTGGSVRQPAALCGLLGYKATAGMWPTDGIFSLAPTLDSLGLFAKSAADAALLFSALTTGRELPSKPLRGLRLGRPAQRFFDDLQPDVESAVRQALETLEESGVELVPFDLPEVSGSDATFARLVPAELLAFIGTQRFLDHREIIDPVVRARLSEALDLPAAEYITLLRRHRAAVESASKRMDGLDGWVAPTTPVLAPAVEGCATVEAAFAWNRLSLRNTQPINFLGECAVSIPLRPALETLPVGLQLACAPDADASLLAIALSIEGVLGRGRRPDLGAGYA